MLINREILETVGDRLLGEGAMSRIRRRLATVRVHNEQEVTQAGTQRRGEKASLRDGLPTPKPKRARRCGHPHAVSRYTVVSVRCAA